MISQVKTEELWWLPPLAVGYYYTEASVSHRVWSLNRYVCYVAYAYILCQHLYQMVELVRIEPTASCLQDRCSPNCAIAPYKCPIFPLPVGAAALELMIGLEPTTF